MRLLFIILFFLPLCLLSACASIGNTASPKPETQNSLAVRKLETGSCGLFVWKADASRDFILFASETDMAVLQKGVETPLTANGSISDVRSLAFTDLQGRPVKLQLADEQKIEGGARYKSGSLVMVTDEGWEQYISVVGLYACQLLKTT